MVVQCLEDPFTLPQALGLYLLQQSASELASSSSPATLKIRGRGQGGKSVGHKSCPHFADEINFEWTIY